MLRLAIIAIAIWYLVRLFRRLSVPPSRNTPDSNPPLAAGEMAACSRCGVFVLKSEALRQGENLYCGEPCRSGTG